MSTSKILNRETQSEILNLVSNVEAGMDDVSKAVESLRKGTSTGLDQVSAGVDTSKVGLTDVQGALTNGNSLMSASIKQILGGVGQLSDSIRAGDQHLLDSIGSLGTSLSSLEHDIAKDFDRIAADVDGIYPHVTRKAFEITEAMRNIPGQIVPVLLEVSNGQKRLENHQHEAHVHAFYTWLSPLTQDLERKHQEICNTDARQEGIGNWLSQTPEYQNWWDGPPTILWCVGNQGVGKTMLTAFIIEKIRHVKPQNAAIAFLYSDFRQPKKQNPIDVVGSVVYQLAIQQADPAESLSKLIGWNARRTTSPTLEELSTVLRSVTQGPSPIYLVIDAIDECPSTTRDTLLQEIHKLGRKFHVLITTRQVDRHYDAATHLTLSIKAREDDITKYIATRLDTSIGFDVDIGQDEALRNQITKRIVQVADGMSVNVRFCCRLLTNVLQVSPCQTTL